MQEYEFTPKSKLMTVQEGREEIVEIVATRVAHSLYGTLSGLKGRSLQGYILCKIIWSLVKWGEG